MENYHSPSAHLLCLEEEIDEDSSSSSSSSSSIINLRSTEEKEEEEEDGYVKMLLHRENTEGQSESQSSHNIVIDDWIKCARLDAITWILKTRSMFGFRYQTAYLCVTYFDRFLSTRSIDSKKYWAIRLLSLACLSLAAKMEECRVPALSEFQAQDYNFDSTVKQRMELLVLNTLEWKMGSITPFSYIHYLLKKLCNSCSPPRNVVISKTVQLILATMRDVNLMVHRPSVIAMAATLMALDQKLTRQTLELKFSSLFPIGFLQIEDVFSCYNGMQELEMGEVKIPICVRGIDGLKNSSDTSAISTERKRLTFTDCDQNNDIPDEKQQR